MIWSHEVEQITQQTQADLAQNAEYSQYMSQMYGAGANGILAGGGMWGGAPAGQPFTYGNPSGYQADVQNQIGQTTLGGMRGAVGAAAGVAGLAMGWGPLFGAPMWIDPYWATLMKANRAGAGVIRGAGVAAPGFFRGMANIAKAPGMSGMAKAGLMGRATLGAAMGAAPMALAMYGAYKAGSFGLENFWAGAEEQLAVNQTLLTMGNRTNLPGMPNYRWNMGDMFQMGRTVNDISWGNIWTNPQEVTGILGQGLQSGMFRNVQSPQELRSSLRELTDALRDTARTFNTTMSGAMPILQQYRGLGFSGFNQAAGVVQTSAGLAMVGGYSPETMYGFASLGARSAQAFGLRASGIRQGAISNMEFGGRIGYAAQTGAISEDTLLEMTGMMGEGARAQFAQQINDSARRMMSGRWGRISTMAMMDPVTGESSLANSGRLGNVESWVGGARKSLGSRSGIVKWMLNRRRVGEQAIQQMGPEGFMGATFDMLAERVQSQYGTNEDTTNLVLQRLTGEDYRYIEQIRQLQHLLPELRQEMKQESAALARQAMGEATYRENVNLQAVWRKFKRATIDKATRPIKEFGAGVIQNLSQGFNEVLEDIAGVRQFNASNAVARSFEEYQMGNVGPWERANALASLAPGARRTTGNRDVDQAYSFASGAFTSGDPTNFGAGALNSGVKSALLYRAGASAAFGIGSGLMTSLAAGNTDLAATYLAGRFGVPAFAAMGAAGASVTGAVGTAVGAPLLGLGRGVGAIGAGITSGVEGMGFTAGLVPRVLGSSVGIVGGAVSATGLAAGGLARAAAGPWGALAITAGMAGYGTWKTWGQLEGATVGPEASMLLGEPAGGGGGGLLAIPAGASSLGMAARHNLLPGYDVNRRLNTYSAPQLEAAAKAYSAIQSSSEFGSAVRGVAESGGRSVAEKMYNELQYVTARYGSSPVAGQKLREAQLGAIATSSLPANQKEAMSSYIRAGNGSAQDQAARAAALAEQFGAPGSRRDILSNATKPLSASEIADLMDKEVSGRGPKANGYIPGHYDESYFGGTLGGWFNRTGNALMKQGVNQMGEERGGFLSNLGGGAGGLLNWVAGGGYWLVGQSTTVAGMAEAAARWGFSAYTTGGKDPKSMFGEYTETVGELSEGSQAWLKENTDAVLEAITEYRLATDPASQSAALDKMNELSSKATGGASSGQIAAFMQKVGDDHLLNSPIGKLLGDRMQNSIEVQRGKLVTENRKMQAAWSGAFGGETKSPIQTMSMQYLEASLGKTGIAAAKELMAAGITGEEARYKAAVEGWTKAAVGVSPENARIAAAQLKQAGLDSLSFSLESRDRMSRLLFERTPGKDGVRHAKTDWSTGKQVLGVMAGRYGIDVQTMKDQFKDMWIGTGMRSGEKEYLRQQHEYLTQVIGGQVASSSKYDSDRRMRDIEMMKDYSAVASGVADEDTKKRVAGYADEQLADATKRGVVISGARGKQVYTKTGGFAGVEAAVDNAVGSLTSGLEAASAALKKFSDNPGSYKAGPAKPWWKIW